VNRKLSASNTSVQLLILYTDPERHNAQRYRRTDGRTTLWCHERADHTIYYYNNKILRAVRSAEKGYIILLSISSSNINRG